MFEARYELNCGDPKIAETYMNQAMTINDLEPLVKIVRGGCKVQKRLSDILSTSSPPSGAAVESTGSSGRCGSCPGRQSQTSPRSSCQGWRSLPSRQLWTRPRILSAGSEVNIRERRATVIARWCLVGTPHKIRKYSDLVSEEPPKP